MTSTIGNMRQELSLPETIICDTTVMQKL